MDPITLIALGAISISLVGVSYVLIKKSIDSQVDYKSNKKSFDHLSKNHEISFAFTKTKNPPINKIRDIIDNSINYLDIAMYTFTDKEISTRIIQATKRGVQVQLITDNKQTNNAKGQFSLLKDLIVAGIPVKINNHNGFMHLKVLISDHRKIVTGSYNYTGAAKKVHDEVIVIIEDHQLVQTWTNQFNSMWNDNTNFKTLQGGYDALNYVS